MALASVGGDPSPSLDLVKSLVTQRFPARISALHQVPPDYRCHTGDHRLGRRYRTLTPGAGRRGSRRLLTPKCRKIPDSAIYVDSLVYSPEALRGLLAIVGPERVLPGTDFPFDMGIEDPPARLAAANLAPHDCDLIAGATPSGWV